MNVEELPGYMTDDAAKAEIERLLRESGMGKKMREAIADTAGLSRWPLVDPKKEAQDVLDGTDANPWLGDECPESTAYGISMVLIKLSESRAFKAGAEHGEREGADAVGKKVTAALGEFFPGLGPEGLLAAAAEKLRAHDQDALDDAVQAELRE